MFLSRRAALLTRAPAFTCLLLLAPALLSACATSSASTSTAFSRVSSSPRYAATDRDGRAVEIEDDGLPVQTPPLVSRQRLPDDPREPFSPNYGRDGVASPPVAGPLPTEATTASSADAQDASQPAPARAAGRDRGRLAAWQ
jgi:hypothetical protein